MKKNEDLEVIRGAASLLVLTSHIIGRFVLKFYKKNLLLALIGSWGIESVIIFFILSGIVIGYSHEFNPVSPLKFLRSRLLRIYPAYLLGIILAIIATCLYHHSFHDYGALTGSLLFLSTLQGWITNTLEFNPVSWSLTFEMFFYLMFALSITRFHKVWIICWFILGLICIPFYYYYFRPGFIDHFIAMFAFSCIWLTGYLLFRFRERFSFSFSNAILALLTLPLISRLVISAEYYDVFKYLVMAAVSIPMFGYLIGDKQKVSTNNRVLWLQIAVVVCAILHLYFYSDSMFSSKLLYALLPVFTVLIVSFRPVFTKVYNSVKGFFLYQAKISYPVYILHYPLLFICSYLAGKGLLFYALTLLSVFLVSTLFQFNVQPLFNKLFKRPKHHLV